MATWTCETCGVTFQRDRAGIRPIRFCSQSCYHKWSKANGGNSGSFKPGQKPWSTGTKGVLKPNSTSFKKGRKAETKCELGDIKIRTDKKGRKRAWVKVADNGNPYDWKLRAVVVWEGQHGPLKKGTLVHHKDRDTLNDAIENLQAMTRAEHLREHRHEFERKRIHAASVATTERHARNRAARKSDPVAPTSIL
jgi:hypothetical protein